MKVRLPITLASLFVFLSIFVVKSSFSQNKDYSYVDSILPRHYVGVMLGGGLLPKASITTATGNYHLLSKTQSSFNGGFVYQINLDYNWNMSYGLQLNITSTNYYSNIPATDLQGYLGNANAPQILDKQAYFNLALPVLLSYNFSLDKQGFYSILVGGKLSYSGFSIDERVGVSMADSNRQQTTIFTGDFTSNKKPWVNYTVGVSKTIKLKNGGLFCIDL